jgi:RNA polymerase sigma-70 factor (ECF subfamily)
MTNPASFAHADDARIAAGLRSGDVEALAEAYRRNGAQVIAIASRYGAGGDDAEDVTQEVFMRLWRRPTDFDPARGSLKTLLLTMARYRAIDRLRSEGARVRREEREARFARGSDEHVGHAVEAESIGCEIDVALSGLPGPERTAIQLAFFDGHTYREVARVLGEAEGTVKSRIRSGLRRLRANSSLVELRSS